MQIAADPNKKVFRITLLRKSPVFVITIISISKFTPWIPEAEGKLLRLTHCYVMQISVLT